MSDALQDKILKVEALLKECERVIVAFSGGVDSTLLVKLARETLGRERVLAVTADSPSMARADRDDAAQLAQELDVQHRVIGTSEVSDPSYRENSPNRCYVCKRELFERLRPIALEQRIRTILYGAISDDVLEERPGGRAASACGVRGPLQEAGLSKVEVREAARRLGLRNWNKPQNACLSSRIPHGLEVNEQKLRQIEQAEAALQGLGFRQVRVRHLGEHARIEVGADEVRRFEDPALAGEVANRLAALGFRSTGVSRTGYRSGGANDISNDELELRVAS